MLTGRRGPSARFGDSDAKVDADKRPGLLERPGLSDKLLPGSVVVLHSNSNAGRRVVSGPIVTFRGFFCSAP
jgi:hypothetical protein